MNAPSESLLCDSKEGVIMFFELVFEGLFLISSKLTHRGNTCSHSLFFDLFSMILSILVRGFLFGPMLQSPHSIIGHPSHYGSEVYLRRAILMEPMDGCTF